MAAQDKVRMNLQVSPEMNSMIDDIAGTTGSNRSDVIRQAIALMKIAHDAKQQGKHFGIVANAAKLDTEIVGLI